MMDSKLKMYRIDELASVIVEMVACNVTGFTLDALEARLDEKYEKRPQKKKKDTYNMWTDPNDGISSPPSFG